MRRAESTGDPRLVSDLVPFVDVDGLARAVVVVKATFSLRDGQLAEVVAADPLREDTVRDDRTGSLLHASDRAIRKPRADVIMQGVVRSPRRRQVVGFALARGADVLLEKWAVAVAAETRAPSGQRPYAGIDGLALFWENTSPGSDRTNPAGSSDNGARLVDPVDRKAPMGFGPIAPSWPSRSRRLGPGHAEALASSPPYLPEGLDEAFFQVAPSDQWVDHLLGGEQVLVVGVAPTAVTFRLPALFAHAILRTPNGPVRRAPLVCDTLWIDMETQRASLTYRGDAGLVTAPTDLSRALAELRVVAGLGPAARAEETLAAPAAWRRATGTTSLRASGPSRRRPPAVDDVVIQNDTLLVTSTLSWTREGRSYRTVMAKGTFILPTDGDQAAWAETQEPLTGDVADGERFESALLEASDYVPLKVVTDVTVRGHAHAPVGRTSTLVRVAIGSVDAQLVAVGPRTWKRGVPSEPGPMDPVRLCFENAFGGEGHAPNPVGTGLGGLTPPPQLEDPNALLRHAGDRPEPVGWGPISPVWSARRCHLGTFDARWVEERWPDQPGNFDPRFFQSSPVPLQAETLKGDEPFILESVRPGGEGYRGRLPGLRPRVIADRPGAELSEVVMRIDTVRFDADRGRLSLVWRGSLDRGRAESHDATTTLHVLLDPLGKLRSGDALAIEVEARRARELSSRSDAEDPTPALDASEPARRPPPKRALLPLVPGAHHGQTPPPAPARDAIVRAIRAGEDLAGRDLSGVDLRGVDLARADLSGAILAGAKLEGACLDGAILARANLVGIEAAGSSWVGADLTGADLTGAHLVEARLGDATLARAVLDEADLTDARLEGITAGGSQWVEANLTRCRLDGAALSKADLSRANVGGASLCRSELTDAKLHDVNAAHTVFDEAEMADARLHGAHLEHASFRASRMKGAVLECAVLDQANLEGADLSGAVLDGASLARVLAASVLARGASFREADLQRARLDGADLMQAVLEGADLSGASLVGASLFEAAMRGTRTRGANLEGALVAGTLLDR